jgi:hypothetical protein
MTFKNIYARFHTFHRMGASQERAACSMAAKFGPFEKICFSDFGASTKQPEIVGKEFRVFCFSCRGDALRKMVLLRWSAGAVGAGSVPGGAVGGARFGVLRLGEGRVPSRD